MQHNMLDAIARLTAIKEACEVGTTDAAAMLIRSSANELMTAIGEVKFAIDDFDAVINEAGDLLDRDLKNIKEASALSKACMTLVTCIDNLSFYEAIE